uniref:Kelch-like protein 30 n=1 Tax=Cacopsylla melanoneura TaxID=428564 RepID=A0A8D9AH41_9HEMI
MTDTDVTLIVDGVPFQYNKELLMRSSQYFSAMFSDHFAEKNKSVVHIQDVNPDCLQVILDNILEDQNIDWEQSDTLQLLRTASLLQFDQIQDKCVSFILDTWLTIDTCLRAMFSADELGISTLYKRACTLAQWKFDKVIERTGFKSLSFEHLYIYLTLPGLNITNEFKMFEAIHLWIDHDFNARCSHINTLLELIHYSQLPLLELNDMLFYSCVHESEYAKSLLNCIKNMKIDKSYACSDEKLFITARQLVEKPDRTLPIMCFIFACVIKTKDLYLGSTGGCPNMKMNNMSFQPVILYHDTREDTLKISLTLEKMCEIPDSVMGHQVIPIDQHIWIIGGEYQMGKGDWNMSVWKFNTWSHKWEHETCLPTPRRHHSVVVLDNEIFVIGGVGRYRVMLETVDRYNIQTKLWDKCSNLPSSGYLIACCSHQGSIYMFDGNRVLYMKPPLYTWILVGTLSVSVKVDVALSYKQNIFFTESGKSNLYKLNVLEEDLPLEDLGHFQIQSLTKTCLVNNIIYHWSEDDDIISLESYDIDRREFTLRWSKHRDEFTEKIHLNRTAGSFTMLHYD